MLPTELSRPEAQILSLIDAANEEPQMLHLAAQDGVEMMVMLTLLAEREDERDLPFLVACAMHSGNARCVFELVSHAWARCQQEALASALIAASRSADFNGSPFLAKSARGPLRELARVLPYPLRRDWERSLFVAVH